MPTESIGIRELVRADPPIRHSSGQRADPPRRRGGRVLTPDPATVKPGDTAGRASLLSRSDQGTTVLAGIVIDALDVARMEEFWAEATQGRTHGLYLRFEAAAKPKTGKNRLHLDLAGGEGWDAEVERLVALGAARADIGQGEVDWDVLTDPEGNEFCVLRPGHPGVRPGSGIAAICLDVATHDRFRQLAFWQAQSRWKHVQHGDGWTSLRCTPASPVSLLMGPPAAAKTGRNRLRLEVTHEHWETGEFCDPGGNEFHVTRPPARA